jgi:hypothetical protein
MCSLFKWGKRAVHVQKLISIGGYWHLTSTSVIPISETNMSDWKTSFRYRHQSSFRNPNIEEKKYFNLQIRTHTLALVCKLYNTKLLWLSVKIGMSDIGYRIKLYYDIRYNVALHSLSLISEVPISGSVRYSWSRILDEVPTYANQDVSEELAFICRKQVNMNMSTSCQNLCNWAKRIKLSILKHCNIGKGFSVVC